MTRFAAILAPILACTAVQPVIAASPAPLTLESRIFRETIEQDVNGAPTRALASAGTLRPGDRVLFVIRYRNDGSTPVPPTSIVSPLPQTVMIDPASAGGLQVSTDGGRRWDRPGATFTITPAGTLRPAPGQAVTHVRFRIDQPIAPGASGQAMFRATLL